MMQQWADYLDKLKQGRSGPVRMLDELASVTPRQLWLTGVDAEWRGHGHGRAMLTALLATPPGKRAYIVRVHRFGRDSPAMAHLLSSFGYVLVQETRNHAMYLRPDSPPELGRRLRDWIPREAAR